MGLTLAVPDYAWKVELTWSKPLPYDTVREGCAQDETAWFYMILKKEGRQTTPYYIGKVVKTCVSKRLKQADHKRLHKEDQRKHPEAKFLVCVADMRVTAGKRSKGLVDDVETMLILALYQRDPDSKMRNKRKWFTHSITKTYAIANFGAEQYLPKEIQLGLFVS